jgi:hypothetical protein
MCARQRKPDSRRGQVQIITGGILGGKTRPVRAELGSSPLAWASVLPARSLSGSFRSRLVVHGKEKVYGSIP